MERNSAKQIVKEILDIAGVEINGSKPWDVKVNDEKLYSKVLAGGTLALGESYMDGWWDCENLDQFFDKVIWAGLEKKISYKKVLAGVIKAKLFNQQTKSKAKVVGEQHYDVGNDLYKRMLDKRMVYTCGYWKDAENLDQAQEAKLDLVCKKLKLKKGMTVLDIGCGWGSFAKFAAEKYGVKVVGITISKEQIELGNKLCKGLDVELRFQDYRDLKGEKFDRIVSLGMIEHVGYKNYREYMKIAYNALKDDGMFLIQTIAGNKSVRGTNPWINKYIFPNGMLPSAKQLTRAFEKIFILEDWHSFGTDYDKTLMAWHENFNNSWNEIKKNYDDRFFRMWNYYLLMCAGSFRSRRNQLWQIVLSKKGVRGRYNRVS